MMVVIVTDTALNDIRVGACECRCPGLSSHGCAWL